MEHASFVYDGWEGYNQSLTAALAPLTLAQLSFRASPDMNSVAEIGWHIGDGRVDWFSKLRGPGVAELAIELSARRASESPNPADAAAMVTWLNRTWKMVEATLAQWSVEDLHETYKHPYQGKVYAVSRQWTIWRILTHDAHHGGQLSEVLAMQGILPLELTWLGGHLAEPPETGE